MTSLPEAIAFTSAVWLHRTLHDYSNKAPTRLMEGKTSAPLPFFEPAVAVPTIVISAFFWWNLGYGPSKDLVPLVAMAIAMFVGTYNVRPPWAPGAKDIHNPFAFIGKSLLVKSHLALLLWSACGVAWVITWIPWLESLLRWLRSWLFSVQEVPEIKSSFPLIPSADTASYGFTLLAITVLLVRFSTFSVSFKKAALLFGMYLVATWYVQMVLIEFVKEVMKGYQKPEGYWFLIMFTAWTIFYEMLAAFWQNRYRPGG